MDVTYDEENLDLHPVADTRKLVDQVPIIDVGDLINDTQSAVAANAIDEMADACRSWGFFQVVNHGICSAQIAEVWRQTQLFFQLPTEEKLQIVRNKENPWGFYNNELTKNQRDKKEVFDFTLDGVDPIYGMRNRWPQNPTQFRTIMESWRDACTDLSLTLLEGFCLGLNLPATFMHGDFADEHTGFVRLNYYPIDDPLAAYSKDLQSNADLGIHHHTDAGALTVLLQDDVGGLQVYRDGYWHNIPCVEDALVINTGDMMQVWSNDVYKAAIHRVLAMENTERYSIPFFLNPSASAVVEPLPSVISKDNPAVYHPIEWGHFRGQRSYGDYADLGSEIQIAQYRK
ncbi:MAG: 2OG-Fe(II) oxygenase family protein [Pseudomonadota bacterium]